MEVIPLITGLCILVVSLSVAQAELLKISPRVYSGKEDPSWDIPKPVDATRAAHFEKLVGHLMNLPKPLKEKENAVSGYNGFSLKHVLDNGEVHLIEIAKCRYPILETALLETAPKETNPKVPLGTANGLSKAARTQIQEGIDNCPSEKSLAAVLQEGQKTSNVDIQFMLANIHKCQGIVQQLTDRELDPFYTNILNKLSENLQSHCTILDAKINQLNSASDQQVPVSKAAEPIDAAAAPISPPKKNGDRQDHQRRSAIQDTIVVKGGLTFQDIAGLHDAKQALTEAIIMPLHFPQLFTGCIKPWKRILLFGPPGTGKSRIAQAISAEISSTFYCVSSSDLISSWVGESEKLIKELFQHATNQPGRSVIFIDEIDSICRQRSSREEEHTRRMKTELLKQMEGADNSKTSDKIFLLCATNCPWELDSAFLRRFQKRIYIPLPDRAARIELIKIHTRENKLTLTDDEWRCLGDKTEGYSGSDIATMTLGALFGPIRDLQAAMFWYRRPDGKFTPCPKETIGAIHAKLTDLPPDQIVPRDVSLADFIKSLQTHRQTVTETELKKFSDFTSNFGEKG